MELSVFLVLSIFVLSLSGYKIFSKEGITATKPLGWFSLVASFLATQIGSSSLIYTAEFAYCDGIGAILYPLGTSLGLLALSLGVGAKIHKLQLSDVSDVFEKHYGSGALKKISCFILVLALLGFLIAQAMWLKELLTAIGIAQDTLFIAIWMAIVFLTLQGAMTSAAWTEVLQILLVLGILSAVYFFSPQSSYKGISLCQGMQGDLFDRVNGKLSSYLLMPCFIMFLEPEMIQNIPLVRSKRKIWTAALFAGLILLIISLVPVYCGITGKAIESEQVLSLPQTTNSVTSNSTLATCCTCLLLFAFACSSSSLLRSLATKLKEVFANDETQKQRIPFSWSWTLILGTAVLIASYYAKGITEIILNSYELVVVCLLVPVVQAAFSRSPQQISKKGAALSMLFGGVSFCLCHIFAFTFFPEILSLAFSWLGFLLGKALSKEQVLWHRSL